jgi:hypothetical protein
MKKKLKGKDGNYSVLEKLIMQFRKNHWGQVISGCPKMSGEHKVHPYAHPEILCRGGSCIRPFRSFYRFFLFSDSLIHSLQ